MSPLPTILALLVLVSAFAAAANHMGGPGGQGRGFDAHERAEAMGMGWSNMSEAQREHARERAEDARLFSVFEMEGARVGGRYVNFSFDAEAGTVSDYEVGFDGERTTFLDEVAIEPWSNATEARVAGAAFRVPSDDALLVVHNNPTAQLRVIPSSNDTTVTFDLADGTNVTRVSASHFRIDLAGRHAHIVATGGGNLTADDERVVARLGGGDQSVAFLAHPLGGAVHAAGLHAQMEAMASGRLGGHLSLVDAGDGTPAELASDYGVSLRAREMQANRTVIRASSEEPQGRAVLVDLPLAALGNASGPANMRVLLDGEEVPRATGLEQVLAANGTAAWHATVAGNATQVAVFVPGFSDHDITIESADDDATAPTGGTTPTGMAAGGGDGAEADTPGFGALALFSGVAVAALLASRRRG